MSDQPNTRMSVTLPSKLMAKIKSRAKLKKWSNGEVIRDCVEAVLITKKADKAES